MALSDLFCSEETGRASLHAAPRAPCGARDHTTGLAQTALTDRTPESVFPAVAPRPTEHGPQQHPTHILTRKSGPLSSMIAPTSRAGMHSPAARRSPGSQGARDGRNRREAIHSPTGRRARACGSGTAEGPPVGALRHTDGAGEVATQCRRRADARGLRDGVDAVLDVLQQLLGSADPLRRQPLRRAGAGHGPEVDFRHHSGHTTLTTAMAPSEPARNEPP